MKNPICTSSFKSLNGIVTILCLIGTLCLGYLIYYPASEVYSFPETIEELPPPKQSKTESIVAIIGALEGLAKALSPMLIPIIVYYTQKKLGTQVSFSRQGISYYPEKK